MGFLTSLFSGGDGTSWWGAAFALIFVLVLIIAGLWLLKIVFNASGSVARGRNRRLAIIDSLAVDGKRNLVLVRRDDVEHLLVVGGNNDVLVESGIAVEHAVQRLPRRPEQPASRNRPQDLHRQDDPHRQTAAASRLGLTGLLRRYGQDSGKRVEPSADTPTDEEPAPANVGRGSRKRPGAAQPPASRPLRHTGLLRPAPKDEPDIPGEFENPAPEGADSAKNGAGRADVDAMASIEEGAASEHGGAGEDMQHAETNEPERHN